MKYFLIGYMGSGKSTLGKLLAQDLGVTFYDLDFYIEAQEGMSIPEIFQSKGEIYFRRIEHQALAALVAKKESMVLSLGGGTPCYAGNMQLLVGNGIGVYLNYPLEVLVNRLWKAKENRPLIAHLQDIDLLEDFIRKHLFERAPYYLQAQYNLKLEDKSLEEALAALKSLIETAKLDA